MKANSRLLAYVLEVLLRAAYLDTDCTRVVERHFEVDKYISRVKENLSGYPERVTCSVVHIYKECRRLLLSCECITVLSLTDIGDEGRLVILGGLNLAATVQPQVHFFVDARLSKRERRGRCVSDRSLCDSN